MKDIPYKIHPKWSENSPDIDGMINIRGNEMTENEKIDQAADDREALLSMAESLTDRHIFAEINNIKDEKKLSTDTSDYIDISWLAKNVRENLDKPDEYLAKMLLKIEKLADVLLAKHGNTVDKLNMKHKYNG